MMTNIDEIEERVYENNSKDVVTQFQTTGAKFPCILVPKSAFILSVSKYVQTLLATAGANKTELKKLYADNGLTYKDVEVSIYAYNDADPNDRVIEIGTIMPTQVRTFLRVLPKTTIKGMLNKDTPLSADELVVLIE